LEKLNVSGRIILKCVFKKNDENVDSKHRLIIGTTEGTLRICK
jgi:hypothetical protein